MFILVLLWQSQSLYKCVLIVFLSEQVIIYNVGLIASQYFKVLGEKDFEAFKITTLKSAGFIVSIAFVSIVFKYFSDVLSRKCP